MPARCQLGRMLVGGAACAGLTEPCKEVPSCRRSAVWAACPRPPSRLDALPYSPFPVDVAGFSLSPAVRVEVAPSA